MRCVLILFIACLLASCQILRKLNRPVKAAATADDTGDHGPIAIAKIELINPDDHFVLARLGSNLMLAPGSELFTLDASGQNVKLKLAPERKGLFLTADIVSGEPVKGGIVYMGTAPTESHPGSLQEGPPSAANPPTISISPPSMQAPARTLPDTIAPGDAPDDFLRIVPKQ